MERSLYHRLICFQNFALLRTPRAPVLSTSDVVTIKSKISISIIPDIVNINERFSVTSKFASIEKQERTRSIRLNRDKYYVLL